MSEENTIPTPEPQQPQPEPVSEPQPEPEPQQVNPYQTIIDQQGEQIAALIAANQALTQQVTNMIQNGAQLGGAQPVTQTQQAAPTAQLNTPSLASNDDWSLEDLAKEIGKK